LSSKSSNGLVKAQLIVHDENGNKNDKNSIPVLFNPQQYSINKSNQFASLSIPGRSSSIIQFVKGESETLSFELFFDTYTYYEGVNVKNYTDKIKNLMDINSKIHAPPICTFEWGSVSFTGIVESINTTFTMFLQNGTPVRAKMTLSLKQYQKIQNSPKLSSPTKTKMRTVVEGDSLWLIAASEFGDPSKWKEIADVNNIENPLVLYPGTKLIIPKIK
jgi:nucleoid-associated protein YgaU